MLSLFVGVSFFHAFHAMLTIRDMQNNSTDLYYHVGVSTASGLGERTARELDAPTPHCRASLLGGEVRGNTELLLFWVAGDSIADFLRRVREAGAMVTRATEFVTTKTELTPDEIASLL